MCAKIKYLSFIAFLGFFVSNALAAPNQAESADTPKRLVQTDPILGKQYHKQQYEMRDGKICPVDTFGQRQYHKPCLSIEKK